MVRKNLSFFTLKSSSRVLIHKGLHHSREVFNPCIGKCKFHVEVKKKKMLPTTNHHIETEIEDRTEDIAGSSGHGHRHTVDKSTRIIPDTKLGGYEFWKSIGSPKHVVAPMVDQSELAFRILAHNHGAHLAYTPMFHSKVFKNDETYRTLHFQFLENEGPVFAQFCANDPDTFVECGWLAWEMSNHKISAIDLNLGCPQRIAKKGRYGSYIMENFDLVYSLINKAHKELPVPVTAKIRIFEDIELTLKYVDTVVSAGAQVLCVHGRTRDQRGHNQNYADWEVIKLIREHVPQIPVIANGNVRMYQDVLDCLEYTGVDAVMSAEPLLCNPALFNGGTHICPIELCDQYLDICERYPPPEHSFVKRHIFHILDRPIGTQNHFRAMLGNAHNMEQYRKFVNYLKGQKETLYLDAPQYEPSIMVVRDPANHPIDKKPKGRGCQQVDLNEEEASSALDRIANTSR
ncbi:hypothetical protein C9374_013026 [Naegleria lovaniensis]|uniref:tRNA-dihydrouridine(16/17) synthase [NAD(P)(+)] n=1 Tax=Naegleria lovaniensis TaxID=51637 RepID=A0AA88KDG0_NAELO|nr:uncharacterized protein C9374_013026 [Naegleria lovaniensis]KAG2372904.1 hypothetical protein C9374_013026 [Naegleria lovaniensis]